MLAVVTTSRPAAIASWIKEHPTDELPPHIRTLCPVGVGFKDGSGSLRCTNKAVAAVEIETGRTAALSSGKKSGTAETKISRVVE